MQQYIIGYESTLIDNWDSGLIEPEPPASYSGSRLQRWIENQQQNTIAECSRSGFTSKLTRVAVVEVDNPNVLSVYSPEAFLQWVLDNFVFEYSMGISSHKELIAFTEDPKAFLSISAFTGLRSGTEVPVGYWKGSSWLYDPFDTVLSVGAAKQILKLFSNYEILSRPPANIEETLKTVQWAEKTGLQSLEDVVQSTKAEAMVLRCLTLVQAYRLFGVGIECSRLSQTT